MNTGYNQGIRPLGKTALKDYSVNLSNDVEELSWSLYDFNTYAAAGQTALTFFQNPIGQASKTIDDTNMVAAGQIPKGQNFLVQAICVEFQSGAAIGAVLPTAFSDDQKAVMEAGVLTFGVGSKLYKQEGPLGLFPQQYGLTGYAAVASTVAATNYHTNYGQITGAAHNIVPVRLTSNQNFIVTLNWATVKALPSTIAGRIGVRLMGRLYRNAQ